jgi:hypothetical protein
MKYIRESMTDAISMAKEAADSLQNFENLDQSLQEMIDFLIPQFPDYRKVAFGKHSFTLYL